LEASSGFTDRPLLLSSLPERNGSVFDALCIRTGHWQSRDRFFLMTDALACWFMRECEKGRRPWRRLSNLESGQGFRGFSRWIGELRRDGSIKNDDVTLVRITVA
jgi:hypothetical protein